MVYKIMATNRRIKKKVTRGTKKESVFQSAINDRIKNHIDGFNKVFDKFENNKKKNKYTHEQIVGILHDILDKLSISDDAMVIDMLPLSILNHTLKKDKGMSSIGYCVYVDGKTDKIHTLLINGDSKKMDELFIEGKV
jgi:hypothetical protein